jgi:hypothetical protein
MTDIVRRLRSSDVLSAPVTIEGVEVSPLALMAADEIERLREALRGALRAHDIEEAEHPSPNRPVWVEAARAALGEERARPRSSAFPAAAAAVRRMAARMRAMDPVRIEVLATVAALEQAADMLEATGPEDHA